jgi:hypothetical protein
MFAAARVFQIGWGVLVAAGFLFAMWRAWIRISDDAMQPHRYWTGFLGYVAVLTALYFVAWTGAYILTWVSRGDTIEFRYYFGYLVAAWTFSGLEMVPQFMLVLSIILFFLLAVPFQLLLRRRKSAHIASGLTKR